MEKGEYRKSMTHKENKQSGDLYISWDEYNKKIEDLAVQINHELYGFEFNQNGKLGSTLFTPFTNSLDRSTGEMSLNLSAYQANIRIVAPGGTTHYRIHYGGAELDFVEKVFTFGMDQGAILPYDSASQAAQTLSVALTADSILPVIGVLGVEFFQEVNGEMYPLKNGTYNALAVTLVDQV